MTQQPAIRIDRSDFSIEKVKRTECEWWCEKGRRTHVVKFANRAIGGSHVAEGCMNCMRQYLRQVQDSAGPEPHVPGGRAEVSVKVPALADLQGGLDEYI